MGRREAHHCVLLIAGSRDHPLSPGSWPLSKDCRMKLEEQQTGSWNQCAPVSDVLSPQQYGFPEDSFPRNIWFPQSSKKKIRTEMTRDLHNCITEILREMLYTFTELSTVLSYCTETRTHSMVLTSKSCRFVLMAISENINGCWLSPGRASRIFVYFEKYAGVPHNRTTEARPDHVQLCGRLSPGPLEDTRANARP